MEKRREIRVRGLHPEADVMGESWMLARLRRETELCHAAADADRMGVMSAGPTVDGYRSFLSRIYGFEASVETALALTTGLDSWIDVRGRARMKQLRADLVALGVSDAGALPRCSGILPFRSVGAALGWMYVLERNRLLHGLVERHLRYRLPEVMAKAGTYLACHERSLGACWRELGDTMDRWARDVREADDIVYSARTAFRAQRGWYQLGLTRVHAGA